MAFAQAEHGLSERTASKLLGVELLSAKSLCFKVVCKVYAVRTKRPAPPSRASS